MSFIIFLIWLGVGSAIGYFSFYFRYEHKESIDWLRSKLNHITHEHLRISEEHKELDTQNRILKDKVNDLLVKNADLNSIVWELNRYYYYLKEWYSKASELVTMLRWVDPVMEEKIKKIAQQIDSSSPSSASSDVWLPELKKKR